MRRGKWPLVERLITKGNLWLAFIKYYQTFRAQELQRLELDKCKMRKNSLSNSCEYTGLAMLSCILVLAVTEGILFHARKIVSYCYLVSFPFNSSHDLHPYQG